MTTKKTLRKEIFLHKFAGHINRGSFFICGKNKEDCVKLQRHRLPTLSRDQLRWAASPKYKEKYVHEQEIAATILKKGNFHNQ